MSIRDRAIHVIRQGPSSRQSFLGGIAITPTPTTTHDLEGTSHTGRSGALLLRNQLSETISASTNNWNPAGLSTADIIRITLGAAYDLTGIVAPSSGFQAILLTNLGSGTLTIKHESASSTAANRFTLPDSSDIELAAGQTLIVVYDVGSARWRPVGGTGSGLTIQESDGAPSVATTTLVVDADLLTDQGGGVARLRGLPSGTIGAGAYTSSIQTPAAGAFAVALDTDAFDTDGFHDPVTNNSRFTIPPGLGGYYLLRGIIGYNGGNTDGTYRLATWAKNGVNLIGEQVRVGPPVSGAYVHLEASAIVKLAPGDYVELVGNHDSASNESIGTTTPVSAPGQASAAEIIKLDSGRAGAAIGFKTYHNATESLSSAAYHGPQLNTDEKDSDGFHFTSNAALTGTVGKTAASDQVLGSGTAFTTELSVNQVISIPGTAEEWFGVKSIEDDTHLTLWKPAANTASGQTATRRSCAICIPAGLGGEYVFKGSTTIADAGSATTWRQIGLGLQVGTSTSSPVTTPNEGLRLPPVNGNTTILDFHSSPVAMSPGDLAALVVRQESGGNLNFGSATRAQSTTFAGYRVDTKPTDEERTVGLAVVIDGAGGTITTGIKGDLQIPFACRITGWSVLLDVSGSIVIDIWKDTEANYPPTVADTITAAAKPTVSGATKASSTTLTGWTTDIAAGDTLRFNVDSASTATRATVMLTVVRR